MNKIAKFSSWTILLGVLWQPIAFGQKATSKAAPQAHPRRKVIIEYKKYQAIDLGDLQIEGEVVAPGDITIERQDSQHLDYELFEQNHFRRESTRDIQDIR